MKIPDFLAMKTQQKPITMVTCYDYCLARIVEQSAIDCVLVGDSAAMVMHGYSSTVQASIEMMRWHTAAVARGIKTKCLITDLPFMSYQKSVTQSLNAIEQVIKAGANGVKLEGAKGNLPIIKKTINAGVPVMGHLGLMPQHINRVGSHSLQAKTDSAVQALLDDALALEEAGIFALVLECIPPLVAKKISDALTIPTIGIGAGPYTNGQVLVLHDLLGLNEAFKPKFLKTYMEGFSSVKNALNHYVEDVQQLQFPLLNSHC